MGWVDTRLKAVTVQALTVLLVTSLGAAEAWSDKIYWSEPRNGKIRRANLDGSNIEDVLHTEDSRIDWIALDGSEGKIYWTHALPSASAMKSSKIRRSNFDESGIEVIVTGLERLGPIALNPAGRKMYWKVERPGVGVVIQRADFDGSGIEDVLLVGGSLIQGLALDVSEDRVYWARISFRDRAPTRIWIRRALLNGTAPVEDLLVGTEPPRPTGIALDSEGAKMYWTESDAGDNRNQRIRRMNLDGSGVEDLIVDGLRLPAEIVLDVQRGKMYWVERGLFYRIRRANLDGSDVEDLVTQSDPVAAIALDLSAPGDCDADGDVDLADYLAFEACFTGPGIAVAADCGCADFDSDADADLADLVAFQAVFTGPQ